jgi:hypothetical protein
LRWQAGIKRSIFINDNRIYIKALTISRNEFRGVGYTCVLVDIPDYVDPSNSGKLKFAKLEIEL